MNSLQMKKQQHHKTQQRQHRHKTQQQQHKTQQQQQQNQQPHPPKKNNNKKTFNRATSVFYMFCVLQRTLEKEIISFRVSPPPQTSTQWKIYTQKHTKYCWNKKSNEHFLLQN